KLNMKEPVTLDDWLAYFEAVKVNDMNENGIMDDEYGLLMSDDIDWSEMFFGAFGTSYKGWRVQDNGQVTPDMISPEMKEAIGFYRMLCEKGYMNPDFITLKLADFESGIVRGNAGSFMGAVYQYNS